MPFPMLPKGICHKKYQEYITSFQLNEISSVRMAIMHYLLVLIVLGMAIPALGRASHSSSAMHNDKSVEISVKTDIHGKTVVHCDEGRTLQNRECQWALKKVAGIVAAGGGHSGGGH